MCHAIQSTQLHYPNIRDTFFRQKVTSCEKNILSNYDLQLWKGKTPQQKHSDSDSTPRLPPKIEEIPKTMMNNKISLHLFIYLKEPPAQTVTRVVWEVFILQTVHRRRPKGSQDAIQVDRVENFAHTIRSLFDDPISR